MKKSVLKLVVCTLFAGLATSWMLAQDSTTVSDSKSDVRTITGCVSKGDSADEFMLTGNDGSTWEVRSSAVSLGDHVGHTVAATGVVSNSKMHNMKEDAKDAAKDSGMKKSNNEHGHLKITDVQMVSETCQR
ncbi:MAG: hypothetical protein M3O09_08570 [Acidobacteriota bacterium]|jgi:hypothetical protein|nr:hypothetical protein [Acidobacteriota bacterium]